MKHYEKEYKYVQLEEVDKDILTDWKLRNLIEQLQALQLKYEDCRKLRIQEEYVPYMGDGLFLFGERLETDEEFEKRKQRSKNSIASAKKRKEKKIAEEKKLLDELKRKYEK